MSLSKRIVGPALICALVVLPSSTEAATTKIAPNLAGAWQTEVTFKTNPPPGLSDGKETSLQGYASDGLMSEFPTATKTTGFGVWKATNRHGGFSYTFREFVFNPSGGLVGYVVVKQTGAVSADGATYRSTGSGQLHSPAGPPLGPPSSTSSVGRRITLKG